MTRQDKLALIEKFGAAARDSQNLYGVPASITVAQAILESGWGQTELATQDNNYFGIKARAGEDYCEFPPDALEKAKGDLTPKLYAKFGSMQESFARHGSLLANADRYQPAMAVASDSLAFAAQLQRCGYSEDPQYAAKLTNLIRQYNLTRFDAPVKEAA